MTLEERARVMAAALTCQPEDEVKPGGVMSLLLNHLKIVQAEEMLRTARAVAEEREACLREVESLLPHDHNPNNPAGFARGYECAVGDAAANLRVRD